MSEHESAPSVQTDQENQRKARADLLTFLTKLKPMCSTFQTANEWADFIGELNSLLERHQFAIPADRRQGLTRAMELSEPSREGISLACSALELELEKTIEALPASGRGCGCLGSGLAAAAIGLLVMVGLIIAVGLFFLRPVEVNVVNAGCGPMFVRQGIPVELQPAINFLGVELPDIIDTNSDGRFQVPGLPLQVAVSGSGRDNVAVTVLGISVPFEISGDTSFIEVNGVQVMGNNFTVGVREFNPHNVIIGCE